MIGEYTAAMLPPAMGPTVAHWRAVSDAVQKFTAQGRWSCCAPEARTLPDFELRWDDPAMATHAAAETAYFAGGRIVVALRSNLPPERVHEHMLHELMHVRDAALYRGGCPIPILEERAHRMAERLARW